jgi:hypothetical protein
MTATLEDVIFHVLVCLLWHPWRHHLTSRGLSTKNQHNYILRVSNLTFCFFYSGSVCYHLFSSPYVSVIWLQACNKTIILYSSSPQKIDSSFSWRSLPLCSTVINKMLIGTFGSPLAWSWPTAYNARRKYWTSRGLCVYAYTGAEDELSRSHACKID